MKSYKIAEFIKGWLVGNFNPSVIQTSDFEVAVKNYKSGDYEAPHYHKETTEITIICNGKVIMGGKEYENGDIILMEPGDVSEFFAITDTITTVIKTPSIPDDKYFI
jgi:quercetin dioxygenase-like cupin family protein